MMDLQTRKITFVQEFLNLQNEKFISLSEKLEPMTMEELNRRIDRSIEDSENGRLTESGDLLSEIQTMNI